MTTRSGPRYVAARWTPLMSSTPGVDDVEPPVPAQVSFSIHPIREGLNIAKSTQKFAPCRDSQNIVYPRICTQEDTSIDIYGYDLIS